MPLRSFLDKNKSRLVGEPGEFESIKIRWFLGWKNAKCSVRDYHIFVFLVAYCISRKWDDRPFHDLRPYNPLIGKLYLFQKCRSSDYQALRKSKGGSGRCMSPVSECLATESGKPARRNFWRCNMSQNCGRQKIKITKILISSRYLGNRLSSSLFESDRWSKLCSTNLSKFNYLFNWNVFERHVLGFFLSLSKIDFH